MTSFTVAPDQGGSPILEVLHHHIPAAPPGYLRQLLKKGRVKKNGRAASEADVLFAGDIIQLPESSRLQALLNAQLSPDPAVLYESREILVVYKPAGLAIHSSRNHEQDNLCVQVENLLKKRKAKYRTSPIHRLDLETSGPVLFGKGKQACSQLGKLFMAQSVEKSYLALVTGSPPDSGKLESLLPAKGKQKQAISVFRMLAGNKRCALLEVQLQTGRQHQIRRQLAELGHPLFGDRRYRGPCPADLKRLFLHCSRLAFVDPFSQVHIVIESPLPTELSGFLAQLNFDFDCSALLQKDG